MCNMLLGISLPFQFLARLKYYCTPFAEVVFMQTHKAKKEKEKEKTQTDDMGGGIRQMYLTRQEK